MFAPDAQKHVPMIMWFNNSSYNDKEINIRSLKNKIDNSYSHDNLFHTILGLMDVKTTVYDKQMDIIRHKIND